jgi:hypothetical protein
MTKFEAGKTYIGRFATDADSRISLSVAARTPSTIKTEAGKTLRIKVCPYTGVERVYPLGRYSMAPTISADRLA